MDRYTRVEKPKPESPINENEIRITSGGPLRNYISYGTSLLQVLPPPPPPPSFCFLIFSKKNYTWIAVISRNNNDFVAVA